LPGEAARDLNSTIQEKLQGTELWCIRYVNHIQDIQLTICDAAGMTLPNAVELLSSYLAKGYKMYMDNYYNSVTLAKLHEPKNVCRTIGQNRDLPTDLKYHQKNVEKR
jgi:hypothetical protein